MLYLLLQSNIIKITVWFSVSILVLRYLYINNFYMDNIINFYSVIFSQNLEQDYQKLF